MQQQETNKSTTPPNHNMSIKDFIFLVSSKAKANNIELFVVKNINEAIDIIKNR